MTQGYLEAFFDRIYDSRGQFAGLEVTPVDEQQDIVNRLSSLHYVRVVDGGRRMRVFIDGPARDDVRTTADQAFGGRVFTDEGGHLALSIELDWLNESDLEAIRNSRAERIAITNVTRT
jgi:hypothetical protein